MPLPPGNPTDGHIPPGTPSGGARSRFGGALNNAIDGSGPNIPTFINPEEYQRNKASNAYAPGDPMSDIGTRLGTGCKVGENVDCNKPKTAKDGIAPLADYDLPIDDFPGNDQPSGEGEKEVYGQAGKTYRIFKGQPPPTYAEAVPWLYLYPCHPGPIEITKETETSSSTYNLTWFAICPDGTSIPGGEQTQVTKTITQKAFNGNGSQVEGSVDSYSYTAFCGDPGESGLTQYRVYECIPEGEPPPELPTTPPTGYLVPREPGSPPPSGSGDGAPGSPGGSGDGAPGGSGDGAPGGDPVDVPDPPFSEPGGPEKPDAPYSPDGPGGDPSAPGGPGGDDSGETGSDDSGETGSDDSGETGECRFEPCQFEPYEPETETFTVNRLECVDGEIVEHTESLSALAENRPWIELAIAQMNQLVRLNCGGDQDCVLGVPEWWTVTPERTRSQLLLLFAPDSGPNKGKACYQIAVPHPRFHKLDVSPVRDYRKGNYSGILTLSDNSKVIVYCESQAEAQRVIASIKTIIEPSYLVGASEKYGQIKGQFQTGKLIAKYGHYYPRGIADNKPETISYFRS